MSHSDIDMHALIEDIKSWGLDRGILPYPDRHAQFKKTAEEVGELLEAIHDNDPDAAEDAIGDIIVTLIMQAEAWGTDIRPALRRLQSDFWPHRQDGRRRVRERRRGRAVSIEASSATRAVKTTAQKMKEDATKALIAGRENDDRCEASLTRWIGFCPSKGRRKTLCKQGNFTNAAVRPQEQKYEQRRNTHRRNPRLRTGRV